VLESANILPAAQVTRLSLTNRLFMLGMERPQNKGLVESALPVMHRLSDEILHPATSSSHRRSKSSSSHVVDAPSDLGFVVAHRPSPPHRTFDLGRGAVCLSSDEVRPAVG